MSPQVTIRPGEVDEATIPTTVGWERKLELGNMRRLLIDVERSQLDGITLNRKSDLVRLDGVDTGRLVDVESGGATSTLVVYSLEWDANAEPFTPGGDERTGTDQQLINALIGEVGTWSAGTVGNFSSGLAFVFNHAHQHEALRRIERNLSGEIQFRDEGTVDYLDRIGSDKSGSVELSASAGTIEDKIRITERGRQMDGTHIRVLGAHEGEAQLFANLVPAGDSGNYENEVTYTSPRWSDASDTDWDRWENKDLTDQSTLEEEAVSLGEEIKEQLVEVETVTPNGTVEIGDTVQVVKERTDDQGNVIATPIDRAMRVHRLVEKAGDRNDTDSAAAVVDHLLLSTRTTARNDTSQDLRSIRQFNTGFQGSSVAINAGPLEKAIDNGDPVTFRVRYPNLEYENTATLQIAGLPYRIDSVGAGSGGGSTESSTNNDEYSRINFNTGGTSAFSGTGGEEVVDTYSPTGSTAWMQVTFSIGVTGLSGGVSANEIKVVRQSDGFNWSNVVRFASENEEGDTSASVIVPKNVAGDTFEAIIDTASNLTYDVTTVWSGVSPHTHDVTFPDHTHPPQPGIYETSDTPSNVDVDINGTTVATNIGSGTFETTVDVGGEFNNDSWNDVTIRSDSLGIVNVAAFIEGYDQIGLQ